MPQTYLPDAIEALKDTLRAGGTPPDEAIEVTAINYEVRPELLRRKFIEATGRDPSDYRVSDTYAQRVAAAKQTAAERYSARGYSGGADLLCREFAFEGELHVAIALVPRPPHSLMMEAVRVECGRLRGITSSPAGIRKLLERNQLPTKGC